MTYVCWDCLRISSAFPVSICAMRVLIALVRCGRASCPGEEEFSRHAPAVVQSLQWQLWQLVHATLATAGRTCTGTYLVVVVSCVVSCHSTSSNVQSSDSRVTSWAKPALASVCEKRKGRRKKRENGKKRQWVRSKSIGGRKKMCG